MSYDPYYTDDYYDPTQETSGEQYFTPEQLAMMQQLMGGGGTLDPYAALTGMAGLPQLDTKGREQPYDLGLAQQRLNFGQDLGSVGVNNIQTYMGGPGAYAPGALDPTFNDKPLQLTQGPMLNYLASTGGIQGTLADLILGGMNPIQAAARVRSMIERPGDYELDETEAAALMSELPQTQGQFAGAKAEPDWQSLNRMADEMAKPYLSEQALMQQPDVVQLPDGRWVQRTQVDSPQMEFLKKMGLPDPRAKYDLQFALQNDPTLGTLLQRSASTQDDIEMMRGEFKDRLKRIQKRRDQGDSDAQQMEKYKSATQQAMSEFFGQTGRRREAPEWAGEQAETIPSEYPSGNFGAGFGMPMRRAEAGVATPQAPITQGWKSRPERAAPPELNLPGRPSTGVQYSMMESLLGKPVRDQLQRVADEAVPLSVQRMGNVRKRMGMEKQGTQAAWEYAMRLAPILNAGRRGQTPASDVIQQRLAPLYAMGALGQR
jgi:hypothetical protein